jgi:iron complex transport system substrate-binding protein
MARQTTDKVTRTRAGLLRAAACVFLLSLLIAVLWGVPADAEKDERPRRIVSLGPTITEKLYLLGVEDRLVGVTTYCTRPAVACSKEKVGSVTQVSIEKILDLRPDLVLATSLMEARAVRSLKRLGTAVAIFNEPASFAEMNSQFIDLGKMVVREDRARKIVQVAERRVARIREKVSGLSAPKVFIQIGSKPLFTATRHSFLNDMVELAGATNIAYNAKAGFYSREEVLARNPDVILITGMGIAPENEKKVWQRFKALNAVRNNRIFMLDPYMTCSPTPETFVEALVAIVAAVHPGLEVKE